ncbi:globoside alpha-1,3-N-acetylgalactosaminyltransferase 1-like isoform X2 [Mastacembelus armatus]|uniref:globoside alpha-1,3-N-acetylgalactosaminyltransferase 1-like isoform X2 n=1 Tax=Mastacembelus armatus TaxID=205130 RepID=UPI000E45C49D|nr:globoside alpha-1,3-N-acetylgalactosaminyltransferase 1-like isoform X2 [Mastacembelus armatus]
MALFPFCKSHTGPVRLTRIQLILYCLLLSLIIYFLHGRKTTISVKSPHPIFHAMGIERERVMTDMMVVKAAAQQTPLETPWGAPLVWGDTRNSAWRRDKFAQRGIHADNPRSLDPPIKLGPKRQLKVVTVAELPGWERLAYRRMVLLADAIRDPISNEVEYIFCADIDQEFVAPVGEEILGDLVATLHPELYGMPRNAFPYEAEEVSSACVEEDEGDYYYTSELYGGLVSEMYRLARVCSVLILQDQANSVVARGLEESYLNRYLIDHRPTCVLSPEYSWWDSALAAEVPVQRLVSLGRQCEAYDKHKRKDLQC